MLFGQSGDDQNAYGFIAQGLPILILTNLCSSQVKIFFKCVRNNFKDKNFKVTATVFKLELVK